ncbi:MAG: hypothetical protein ACK528_10930 [Alphaproteobacteria bacterium]|jgi:hypothetical protein
MREENKKVRPNFSLSHDALTLLRCKAEERGESMSGLLERVIRDHISGM